MKIKTITSSAILVLAIACSVWLMLGVYIDDGERGIRYNLLGKNPGVQDHIASPGFTWRIPFLSSVQILRVTEQSFTMRDSRADGANPHRNALVLKMGSKLQHLNIDVWYQLPSSKLTGYAKIFFGVHPKTVIESILRVQGMARDYESLDDLAQTVKPQLQKTGIKLISLNMINPEDNN